MTTKTATIQKIEQAIRFIGEFAVQILVWHAFLSFITSCMNGFFWFREDSEKKTRKEFLANE